MSEKASQTQFAFQQLGLAGVLKQYRVRVPPNQREYAWTDEVQVSKFLTDLNRAIADNRPDYFLGTIVTIPKSNNLLEVVDGQQRLATTAILLAAIQKYLLNSEKLLAQSLDQFLTDIDRDKRQLVPKLQLNLVDNEYFRRLITSAGHDEKDSPTKPSHHLLISAYEMATKHVRKIVAGLDAKDHGDALNRWITFLEHGATVILVKVPTDRNAYKMFETLNDRGLRTSQADLVKNYLFGESEDRLSEAQEKWAQMKGTLELMDEDDITVNFLRYALIAIRGHLTTDEVYEEVQQHAKGPYSAVTFLTSLEVLATNYIAIFNQDHEMWNAYPDSIRRAIRTMNLFNIKPMRALMLAVAHRFKPKEAAQTFQMFVSWSVRLLLASSTRTSSVERPLATAANRVFDTQLTERITDTQGIRKLLLPIIPNDEEFEQAFISAHASKANLARYYLRSMETQVKKESEPWFMLNEDQSVINLEHVLPLKPEGQWLIDFDADRAKQDVSRIGNLALLLAKQNCDLRSAGFDEKKKVYGDSPYELTSQIANVAKWTHEKIVERQTILANIAVKTWPL